MAEIEVLENSQEVTTKKSAIERAPKVQLPINWKAQAVRTIQGAHWSTWAGVGLSVIITIVLVLPNFKKAPESSTTTNPLKPLVKIPAYDEARFSESARAELDELNQQLAYFLNEESQRTRVQIALAFMGLANSYAQSGEDCKTQIGCLESFSTGRLAELENTLSMGAIKAKRGEGVFFRLLQGLSATEKIEGWRLAIMLVKPSETRTPAEKWELNTRYSILGSGIPIEDLSPRPAMLQQLLRGIEKKRLALRAASPEEQAKFERQQKICESEPQRNESFEQCR